MREYLLRCNHLSKTFGGRVLFDDIGFDIVKNDCIGLLGPNGCGKTTLLKVILGRLKPEDGEIHKTSNVRIRYLEQINLPDKSESVEYFLARMIQSEEFKQKIIHLENELNDPEAYASGRYDEILEELNRLNQQMKKSIDSPRMGKSFAIIKEMGFDMATIRERKMVDLSGGERQKIALAGVLSEPFGCDLLVMDEPTNHLDIESIEWLEEELAGFPGALLIVTHDRYLLDDLANHILDFRGEKIDVYHSGFEEYLEQREFRQHLRKQEFLKAKADEKRYLNSIDKMNRRNRFDKQISSKRKHMRKLSVPSNPLLDDYMMRFRIKDVFKSGKNIADGEGISKSFGDRRIVSEADFEIFSAQKVGLVGANGCGKTTLLKMIIGSISSDAGKINMSRGVRWRYFDQGHLSLIPENTLVDEVLRDHSELDEDEAKALLGQFNFTGKKVYSLVKSLSGGERARLAFLRLIMEPVNFLILDEPTNHMDVASKESIEKALASYTGTVLVVSHDRLFLDRVCDHMFWMADEKIDMYKGNYSMSRGQRLSGMTANRIDGKDNSSMAGLNVKRYVCKKSFTEWQSRTKYVPGDEVYIGDHNKELFEWALENARIVEKSHRKRR